MAKEKDKEKACYCRDLMDDPWNLEDYDYVMGRCQHTSEEVEHGMDEHILNCGYVLLMEELKSMTPYERRHIMALERIASNLGAIRSDIARLSNK